jgi:cation transport regulator ChaB
MYKLWMSVSVLMLAAAFFGCPSASVAQKGKGGGGNFRPFDFGKGQPARPFDQPNSGNTLPQSTRDQLPPGLRDNPENHPGTANHLKKLDDAKSGGVFSKPTPPKAANSLPPEVRDKLPATLRDLPNNNPALANQLRQMGILKDYPQVDPVPSQVRNQMPTWMRGLPYDNPGVANYLGKLGYSIGQDGALISPPTASPLFPGLNAPQSFQPFGGLLRRR